MNKLNIEKTFRRVIFRNRLPVSTGTPLLEGLETNKVRTNLFLNYCSRRCLLFLIVILCQTIMISHNPSFYFSETKVLEQGRAIHLISMGSYPGSCAKNTVFYKVCKSFYIFTFKHENGPRQTGVMIFPDL